MKHTIGGGRSLSDASPDALLDCIDAARGGDQRAARALVEYLLPVVRARVVRVMRRAWGRIDHDRIDDIEQEAWAKVWRSAIGRWSPDGGKSLRNWVGWAAENAARNAIARIAARPIGDAIETETLVGDADPFGEADIGIKTDPERLCPCLHRQCTERDLLIARMLQLDGAPVVDVARALGTSTGQVYKSTHRFKAALRVCIEA